MRGVSFPDKHAKFCQNCASLSGPRSGNILHELIQTQERVFGPKHPWQLLTTRVALARALDGQGRYTEAEAEFRNVIKIEEEVEGPQHPRALDSYYYFACVNASEQAPRSEGFAQRALEGARKVLRDNHPSTLKYEKLLSELETRPD